MDQDLKSTLFFQKAVGSLIGGLIGDSIGAPSEGMSYSEIEAKVGWIDDFAGDGTDDTVMKYLLAEALIRTGGFAGYDDWAQVWLDNWDQIFGVKVGKFFQSVLHTAVKLRSHSLPRMAALGNMPSSSSAMSIAPVGIVNACNPRQAAQQAYHVASLIHTYDVSFCQDAAAAIAAAVAAAFAPSATVESIIQAALSVLDPLSGQEMSNLIQQLLSIAQEKADYKEFRSHIYAHQDLYFRRLVCDSRETVPITLALFYLSEGEVEKTVIFAANFGRDADTIATMGGAVAGAYQGIKGIRSDWVEKARQLSGVDQDALAERLILTSLAKFRSQESARQDFLSIF